MLSVIAYIYGKIVDFRNALYDRGIFESHDLGARTISIGNITTGGTGKTPLVAYVAELLAARGEKVCILSRGYGRQDPKNRVLVSDGETILDDPQITGDEPLELAFKLKGKAIVIADADRVAAAEWAKRKFGITVFVLDDGFQHRKAKRDVDIVCVDSTKPLGSMRMLPAGRLREPLVNLARASAIVITRTELVDERTISDLRSEISNWKAAAPMFEASNEFAGLRPILENHGSAVDITGEKTFAFCGLGNPDVFFDSLRHGGCALAGTKAFHDHRTYIQSDIDELQGSAREAGAAMLLTTAKDAVKLSKLVFELPCFVVKSRLQINSADAFATLI